MSSGLLIVDAAFPAWAEGGSLAEAGRNAPAAVILAPGRSESAERFGGCDVTCYTGILPNRQPCLRGTGHAAPIATGVLVVSAREGGSEMGVEKVGEKYRCNVCGNEVTVTKVGGGTLVCCGEDMEKIE